MLFLLNSDTLNLRQESLFFTEEGRGIMQVVLVALGVLMETLFIVTINCCIFYLWNFIQVKLYTCGITYISGIMVKLIAVLC